MPSGRLGFEATDPGSWQTCLATSRSRQTSPPRRSTAEQAALIGVGPYTPHPSRYSGRVIFYGCGQQIALRPGGRSLLLTIALPNHPLTLRTKESNLLKTGLIGRMLLPRESHRLPQRRPLGPGETAMPYPDQRFGAPCHAVQVRLDIDLGSSGYYRGVVWASGSAESLLRVVARIKAYNEEHPDEVYVLPPGDQFQTYNCRPIAGTTKYSLHSWPVAVDIDPAHNPYSGSGAELAHDMPAYFVEAFQAEGFSWGGDWTKPKDYMHFENKRWYGQWDGTYPDYREFLVQSRPDIQGPATASRQDYPPSFEVDAGANGYYAVEVASNPYLMDPAYDSYRDYQNYWISELVSFEPLYLPDDVWTAMRNADRIYYRVWTSSKPDSWEDVQVSLYDTEVANAPSIELTD